MKVSLKDLFSELEVNKRSLVKIRTPCAENKDKANGGNNKQHLEHGALPANDVRDAYAAFFRAVCTQKHPDAQQHQPEVFPVNAQRIERFVKQHPRIGRREYRTDDLNTLRDVLRTEEDSCKVNQSKGDKQL